MAVSECKCVKWHAPKPTRHFATEGGELICVTSGQAALDLLAKFQAKGRVTKVAGRGFTAFQRELAANLFDAGTTLTLQPLVAEQESEEEEPDGEPVGAAAAE